MTKADIVNEIAKNTGIDKITVLTTVEAFMETVKDSLSKNENVYLRGFGSFRITSYNVCYTKLLRSSKGRVRSARSRPGCRPPRSIVRIALIRMTCE